MKFLLPAKVPQYDLQFQLLASQDYWTNFKNSPLMIEYVEDYANFEQEYANGKWNDYCPVGSIEFCNKYGGSIQFQGTFLRNSKITPVDWSFQIKKIQNKDCPSIGTLSHQIK